MKTDNTKKKSTKPSRNARKMSKSALAVEVRQLRKKLKETKERLEELRAEIKRRDNATAHFKEMEAEEMRLLCLMYPYQKRKRELEAEKGKAALFASNECELFESLTCYKIADFWGGVLYSRVYDCLELMHKAEENTEDKAKVEKAIENLEAETERLLKEKNEA